VRLRNLLLIAIGIFVGYKLATKMREDDPNVVSGPRRESGGSAVRTVSAQAQRLTDQAAKKSLDMIKRARGSLRDRASNYENDDAVWN
jgi:hypothetical protein